MTRNHRRDFLKIVALGALTLLPCSLRSRQAAFAASLPNGNHYLIHQSELVGSFRQVLSAATQFWTPEFGASQAQQMAQQAEAAFIALMPGFPDVGGARNWDVQFIPIAAWYVALYQVMKPAGKSAEDVGHLVYRIYQIELARMPDASARAEGDELFSAESLKEMQAWADWTQERSYPANWVARFIPGDGKAFDYGYDYSECALVKYFRAQQVPELAPYVCLNDFIKSARIGSGLVRTKTLAQGDEVCNFRYHHGGKVTQNWESEITLIRARMQG